MISPLEQRILDSLSPKAVAFVKSLYRKNLGTDKESIAGVRNEDLLHFLSCLERGWMPVGEHFLRSKSLGSASYLFLSANPDSRMLQTKEPSFLAQLKDHFSDEPEGATFYTACLKTSRLYSDIGKIQAVYRYLQTLGIAIEELIESYRPYYSARPVDNPDSEKPTTPDLGEEFFSHVVDSFFDNEGIQDRIRRKENIFNFPRRFPALSLLRQHVPSSLSDQQLIDDLQHFSDRTSILLGFSNDILTKYDYGCGAKYPFAHVETEIGIHVPSKRLPLDASVLVGFESLGTYEDSVLQYLGVL